MPSYGGLPDPTAPITGTLGGLTTTTSGYLGSMTDTPPVSTGTMYVGADGMPTPMVPDCRMSMDPACGDLSYGGSASAWGAPQPSWLPPSTGTSTADTWRDVGLITGGAALVFGAVALAGPTTAVVGGIGVADALSAAGGFLGSISLGSDLVPCLSSGSTQDCVASTIGALSFGTGILAAVSG